MTRELSEECLIRLSGIIEERLGLHFSRDHWKDLKRGFHRVSREFGFTDPQACCEWLVNSPLTPSQVEVLASHLTIGETYFFRDPAIFKTLEREIIPEWLQAHPGARQPLRIWSAGCSTGEEPYTLAMVLGRFAAAGLGAAGATILATDIHPGVLRTAAAGVYREWSFRNMPPEHRAKYFQQTAGGGYQIKARYRKMVTFAYLNLVDDTYPSLLNNTNALDIIFCRNVLMYFADRCRRQALNKLQRCLVEGGWLVVSAIEAALIQEAGWVPVRYPGHLLFRKTAHPVRRKIPVLPTPVKPPCQPAPPAVAPPMPVVPARRMPVPEPKPPAPGAALYADALRLFEQGRHGEAAEKLAVLLGQEKDNMPALILMARTCANQGRFFEALEWCDRILAGDKLNAAVHFLVATVLLELDRVDEARAALKRVLYLDPKHVLAIFTLGNLAWQHGKAREARKYFENVLSLLKGYSSAAVIPESGGLTAERLGQIAQTLLLKER